MGAIRTLLELVLNIIIFLAIFQGATLIHELGHALPALILTKERVKIILGRRQGRLKKISLGRLYIETRGFNPLIGFTRWEEAKLTRFRKIIILAGGPIFSLVLGIWFLIIGRNIGGKLLLDSILLEKLFSFAGNYQIFLFILVSIPIIYPEGQGAYSNFPSDGYQILKLIKAKKDS